MTKSSATCAKNSHLQKLFFQIPIYASFTKSPAHANYMGSGCLKLLKLEYSPAGTGARLPKHAVIPLERGRHRSQVDDCCWYPTLPQWWQCFRNNAAAHRARKRRQPDDICRVQATVAPS